MLDSLLIVKNKFDTSDINYLQINRKLECVLFWINLKKIKDEKWVLFHPYSWTNIRSYYVMLISFRLVINLDDYCLNHSDTPNIKTKASKGPVSIASVANKSVSNDSDWTRLVNPWLKLENYVYRGIGKAWLRFSIYSWKRQPVGKKFV